MASGQQIAKENVDKFLAWSTTMSDDDFIQIIYRGQLNRGELATAVGCAKSAFRQNPALKGALNKLEDVLRARGVLPAAIGKETKNEPKEYDNSSRKTALLAKHNSNLERENIELKAKVKELENKLERFGELNETLSEMGFMLR